MMDLFEKTVETIYFLIIVFLPFIFLKF